MEYEEKMDEFVAYSKKQFDEQHRLIGEFFEFTKTRFDQQDRRLDLMDHRNEFMRQDIGSIAQGQRQIERDMLVLKEDMTGVAGAIAELAEKVGAVEV